MSKDAAQFGDVDIRRALRSRLMAKHAGEADTVVIEELGVCRGRVRIDLVVVDALIHGYEIKSNVDSLRRLDGQIDLYSRVLDRASVVVGDRHLAEALNRVPRWWGVHLAEASPEGPQLKTVRRGRSNPSRDPRSLVELLWLNDAIALLEQRDAARGVRGKPRSMVWDRVCESFAVHEIAAAVRAQLRARVMQRDPVPLW